MAARSPFPPVFWLANFVEVLERFAYYGIYFSFGIYMTSLGYSRDQLGFVQTAFLLLSYCLPLVSGTLADRFGFKPMLIAAYLAYLGLRALCAIEYGAQAIAAHATLLGSGHRQRAAEGVLASLRHVTTTLSHLDGLKGALTIVAMLQLSHQQGRIYDVTVTADGQTLLTGRLSVMLEADHSGEARSVSQEGAA